jgi:hypothetical protein
MLFGRKRAPSRFVDPKALDVNLNKQLENAPRVLEELQKHGVSARSRLRLEFFFYSDSSENAQALSAAMRSRGYQSRAGRSAHDRRLFVITGWSTAVSMDLPSVLEWTEAMCRVGFEHDCEFDGWGTLLDQSQIPPAGPEQPAGGA